jgi:hypothetical protein
MPRIFQIKRYQPLLHSLCGNSKYSNFLVAVDLNLKGSSWMSKVQIQYHVKMVMINNSTKPLFSKSPYLVLVRLSPPQNHYWYQTSEHQVLAGASYFGSCPKLIFSCCFFFMSLNYVTPFAILLCTK